MNKHQQKYLNLIRIVSIQREGECLSEDYMNAHSKLRFKCKHKHIWLATPNSINNGNWCPECSGRKKHTIGDANILGRNKGGRCLSTKYINNKTNLIWECQEGHRWKATLKDIRVGNWCAACAGRAKNTIERCNEIATLSNGTCLSKSYTNAHTKMLWQCSNKHKWKATFNNIRNDRWCPKCRLKTQTKLAGILKKILGHDFIFNYRPNWLERENGYRLEIDIFFPDIKLGVEYNGKQHYEPVKFGNYSDKEAKKLFNRLVLRDEEKYSKIQNNKNNISDFIIFTYEDDIAEDSIIKKLVSSGIRI